MDKNVHAYLGTTKTGKSYTIAPQNYIKIWVCRSSEEE